MQVAGVGNGSQQCNYKINLPIAIPTSEGTQLHSITSPIVEGTGANLPGLLGLDSLRANRAMLDMDKAQLIFPGPGDVKYDLPPGSTIVPLEVAHSGHLVMVTDDYGRLPKTHGGIKDSKLVMIARMPVTNQSDYNAQPEAAGNEPPAVTQLPPIPPVSREWQDAMRHADGRDTYTVAETWERQPPRAPISPQFADALNQVDRATYVFPQRERSRTPDTGAGTAASSRDTRAAGGTTSN